MKHIKIDVKTDYSIISLKLPIMDLKILYNACIDIINEHPSMSGYTDTAIKLKEALKQN